jgi:hypothetical protein
LQKGTISLLRIIKEIEHGPVEKSSTGLILLIITLLMDSQKVGFNFICHSCGASGAGLTTAGIR